MLRKKFDIDLFLSPEEIAGEFAHSCDHQQARFISEVGKEFYLFEESWEKQICWIANSRYLTDAGRKWILELADHIRAQKLKGNE